MSWLSRRVRIESGMSTAEYATGTVCAAAIGCVVYLLADDTFRDLIVGMVSLIADPDFSFWFGVL